MRARSATILWALVFAGCAANPSASGPTPAPSSQAASTPSQTIVPTPATSPIRLVAGATASDAVGDLVHVTGQSDDEPTYVDIVAIKGAADGLNLNLEMALGTEPPATKSSSVERLRYYFAIDSTGDATIDYLFDLENYSDGSYRSTVEDSTGLEPVPQGQVGFVMTIDGRRVMASLPLDDLRSPGSLQFCAFAMSAAPGGGPTFVKDYAPDGFCEGGQNSGRRMLRLT